MQIVDANIILRYLLKDIEELHTKAVQIIENKQIHILFEVIAEVVYVFEKNYEVPRSEIKETLSTLLNYPNISTLNINILHEAFNPNNSRIIPVSDSDLGELKFFSKI